MPEIKKVVANIINEKNGYTYFNCKQYTYTNIASVATKDEVDELNKKVNETADRFDRNISSYIRYEKAHRWKAALKQRRRYK